MKRLMMCLTVAALAACSKDSPIAVDTSAPTVSSTAPANALANVPRNPSVTATFSEAMTASTINQATFTLTSGGTPIAGTVALTGNVATFVPGVTLAANASFTATISTGAKDLAGNALATAKTWTFTTVATPVTGPSAVNLGTAGNYAIVA